MWDEWDLRDGTKDDMLEFDAFYNGFMAPYFGCYRCDETRKALKAIDMDNNGVVCVALSIMMFTLTIGICDSRVAMILHLFRNISGVLAGGPERMIM